MEYLSSEKRYNGTIRYRRCGKSGLLLPAVSLGLWHNFGGVDNFENSRDMVLHAFDIGITHFDLANNYGPPPGSAEENFGRILSSGLRPYRDEFVVSTKAGYLMWPGPYGDWGSRKHLISSLDQSLRRMDLDYVDIFYSHRPDQNTPLDETMAALDFAVRSGRALYAGISNYDPAATSAAAKILRNLGTPCLIHQARYSMFNRWVERELLPVLDKEGVGCIAFSPLAQGLLTDRYLHGIPADSRANRPHGFLKKEEVTPDKMKKVGKLNDIAAARGQKLAQMALTWALRHIGIGSVIIGASKISQIDDAAASLAQPALSPDELLAIDEILSSG